jgi:hypothetical protein
MGQELPIVTFDNSQSSRLLIESEVGAEAIGDFSASLELQVPKPLK